MFRTIIAGTALAGALSLGVAGAAGAAGAATPSAGGNQAAANLKASLCADLPQIQSKVQDLQNTVNTTWIAKLQAAETQAKSSNHTKVANAIAKRITAIQNRQQKVNAWLSKAAANCQSASGSTGSANG